jgi:Mrp family chromosome partitioning ATPase
LEGFKNMSHKSAFSKEKTRMRMPDLSVLCGAVLAKLFQQAAEESSPGVVVALTSAHGCAGVTTIAATLADALGPRDDRLAIAMDCRALQLSDAHAEAVRETPEEGWNGRRPAGSNDFADGWHLVQNSLADRLNALRRSYRYVLLDCPSLKDAQHALRVAPLVDGIILIVEANRTRKDQVLYAERVIAGARGKLLGHVLTKRRYPVPEWFHRSMEWMGI